MRGKYFVRPALFVLLACVFCACQNGVGGGESVKTPVPAKPASPAGKDVSVEPGLISLGKDAIQQFKATDKGGAKTFDWSVSGGAAGTTVDVNGVLTVDAGETAKTLTLTASVSGEQDRYGTAVVRIIGNEDAPAGNGLTVIPQSVILARGDKLSFEARLTENGAPASGETWISDSRNNSSFTGTSLYIDGAESLKTLTVTATLPDGRYGTALVTVLDNESEPVLLNDGIYVSPQTTVVELGKPVKLEAYDYKASGDPNVTANVDWRVFGAVPDTLISGGKLTVVSRESARRLMVRAKAQDGRFGTAIVEIKPASPPPTPVSTMIPVPAGSFTRSDGTITVSAFKIGQYEITQAEWRSLMGEKSGLTSSRGLGDYYPVYGVTWYDAIDYCNVRSAREGLEPAYTVVTGRQPVVTCDFTKNGYRLPTEAEWEYAARGGENFRYSGSDDRIEAGWFREDSGLTANTVGLKKANGYGLYDMSGNLWEWCWDVYEAYSPGDKSDPTGDPGSKVNARSLRGGCCDRYDFQDDTLDKRYSNPPNAVISNNGFRVVCR
ncbi:MAG: SUMF1/EgtB/PvdO family nonheme iron enzyme [Spirochaetaceae bacterium]|nr:SUMF1/EgtB/PvdO family nonheme iron enzyme [Spirochaetaceae bacterium]